ncbi:hypothetical protein NC653_007973 [Populus alba x Populus x berolinensis]|uniref:Uncharacterized protein n=2 Tax=Populus TaxID=3689 RepID=A0A4U5PWX3_POPAL|nr:hypothetical protein NC653_007973 [Populus alba x Populus x berolinensis]TKS01571.1 hypothetical protein D5086_0000171800 [Populus alba]
MEGEWSCWSQSENPTFWSQWRQGCSREEELPDVASMEAERVFGCRAATAIAALGGRSYGERGFDGHGAAEMALLLLFTTKETMDAVRRSTVKLAGRTSCHQGEERWCSPGRAVMGRNQNRERERDSGCFPFLKDSI